MGVSWKVTYFPEGYGTYMPSAKKRITVYVSDEEYAQVARTAKATGESMGRTVGELIEAAMPMLARVAELAEAIKAAPDEVRATFAGAAVQLEEKYGGLLSEAERFWSDIDTVVQGGTPDEGDEGDEGPRLVIRGPES